MCTYSAIADNWRDRSLERYPWLDPVVVTSASPTLQEFEELQREVRELRALLEAAKRFDEKTDQADCEMEEKISFIRKVAELVGVDLSDVLPEEE